MTSKIRVFYLTSYFIALACFGVTFHFLRPHYALQWEIDELIFTAFFLNSPLYLILESCRFFLIRAFPPKRYIAGWVVCFSGLLAFFLMRNVWSISMSVSELVGGCLFASGIYVMFPSAQDLLKMEVASYKNLSEISDKQTRNTIYQRHGLENLASIFVATWGSIYVVLLVTPMPENRDWISPAILNALYFGLGVFTTYCIFNSPKTARYFLAGFTVWSFVRFARIVNIVFSDGFSATVLFILMFLFLTPLACIWFIAARLKKIEGSWEIKGLEGA